MADSTRPSMQAMQRPLIIGALVGIIFGCVLGSGLGLYYAWQVNPTTYAGGAYPTELTMGYQSEYIIVVIDSYIVNRRVDSAQERLKLFSPAAKIRALGERSAAFVANGQGAEAQAVNDLAAGLKEAEGWNADTIANEVGKLAAEYQGDPARSQAITTFGDQLGVVPGEPVTTTPPAEPPPPEDDGGIIAGLSFWQLGGFCLVLAIAIVVIVLLAGRLQLARKEHAAKPQIVWDAEGPPPIKQWVGTFNFGDDSYDEFFTIETLGGDFLGESGMGIMKAIPGTSPKQVIAFDVGLFDKTDITTLSKVVMTEHAYNNDEELQAKVEANPQAEAIIAAPGKQFALETSAMRIAAKIDELEYGEGNIYFSKLKLSMDVFVKEGADLKIGTMDVPEQYQG